MVNKDRDKLALELLDVTSDAIKHLYHGSPPKLIRDHILNSFGLNKRGKPKETRVIEQEKEIAIRARMLKMYFAYFKHNQDKDKIKSELKKQGRELEESYTKSIEKLADDFNYERSDIFRIIKKYENDMDVMTAFIGNCDKIREATGAHVMVIHHSGKDRERGARGHSALKAAVDTEIEVTKDDGIITAEVKKQRDGKTGTKFSFVMQSVTVGQDDDGDKITSCALIPTDQKPTTRKNLKGQKKRALALIRDCMIGAGEKRNVKSGMPPVTCITLDQARDALKRGNISAAEKPDDIRRSIGKVITELNDLGITVTYGDYIWLSEQPD